MDQWLEMVNGEGNFVLGGCGGENRKATLIEEKGSGESQAGL